LWFKKNDNVYVTGNNLNGELGLENCKEVTIPRRLPNIKAKSAACIDHNTPIIDRFVI
jgi:hypothetical protein